MNKKTGIIVGIVGVVVIIGLLLVSSYNKMVKLSEDVDSKYATIEVQLERRADLIPNLVNTVKGYLKHEQDIIDSITTARENLLKANTVTDKAKANNELTNALNSLAIIVENYPTLQSNQNFISLQDELAGTENRIATARKDYNDSVKEFNSLIKSFPNNVMAGMFGFESKSYFEAKESSQEVPNVSFDD